MAKKRQGSRQVETSYIQKLEAVQVLAQRSHFRRHRIKMSVESLEAFGYFQTRRTVAS